MPNKQGDRKQNDRGSDSEGFGALGDLLKKAGVKKRRYVDETPCEMKNPTEINHMVDTEERLW